MIDMTLTRRTFLKVAAVTGVAAAVYPPDRWGLTGLAEAKGAEAGATGTKIIKSACNSCAHTACEVLVHVKDGRVIKIEPDPEGIIAQGSMCPKGNAATQQLYHPDRIKYPMKRVGARGEGKWQRISMDEALDIIANKMNEAKEKYGAETVVISRGTGRMPDGDATTRLTANFGSPNNMSPGHYCWCCRAFINDLTLGLFVSDEDRWNTDCLVFPGAGFFHDHPRASSKLDCIMKTKNVIIADPILLTSSSKATHWLPVRPGTDIAWQLAWVNVMISEGLYNHDWVKQWTNAPFLVKVDPKKPKRGKGEDPGPLLTEADIKEGGSLDKYMVWDKTSGSLKYWDATPGPPPPYHYRSTFPVWVLEWESPDMDPALRGTYKVKLANGTEAECKPVFEIIWERVKEWTPEKAAEVTWVSADKIRETARIYATSPTACFVFGVAMDMQVNMAQAGRVMCLMSSLHGMVNAKGGDWVIERAELGFANDRSIMPMHSFTPEEHKKRLGAEEYPVLGAPGYVNYPAPKAVIDALVTGKPYKPRVLGVWTTTHMCYADQKYYWEAMKEFEFVWVNDLFMTPVAHLLADVVIPATHWLEDQNMDNTLLGGRLRVRNRAVEPMCESISDFDLCFKLGRKVSDPSYYPWKDENDFFKTCFQRTAMTWDEFKEIGQIAPYEPEYELYKRGLLRTWPGTQVGEAQLCIPPRFPYVENKNGFPTKTGKVELYSTKLKGWGYDPLYIHYVEPAESPYSTPELAKKYPLILTTGARSWQSFQSEQRQIAWLREYNPVPDMYINPETARELGIEDGDWCWIENQRGRCRQVARYWEGIDPRVVSARHLWWYPEKPATKDNPYGMWDSNINILANRDATCPVTSAEALRGLLCKVYKAAEGAPEGVWTEPKQFEPWLPQLSGGE